MYLRLYFGKRARPLHERPLNPAHTIEHVIKDTRLVAGILQRTTTGISGNITGEYISRIGTFG